MLHCCLVSGVLHPFALFGFSVLLQRPGSTGTGAYHHRRFHCSDATWHSWEHNDAERKMKKRKSMQVYILEALKVESKAYSNILV